MFSDGLRGPLQKAHLSPKAQTPGPLLGWASLTSKLWFWDLLTAVAHCLDISLRPEFHGDSGVPSVPGSFPLQRHSPYTYSVTPQAIETTDL